MMIYARPIEWNRPETRVRQQHDLGSGRCYKLPLSRSGPFRTESNDTKSCDIKLSSYSLPALGPARSFHLAVLVEDPRDIFLHGEWAAEVFPRGMQANRNSPIEDSTGESSSISSGDAGGLWCTLRYFHAEECSSPVGGGAFLLGPVLACAHD